MIGIIISVIIILLLVIFFGYFFAVYNSLVRLKNNIDKAWSNIDVLLKQRHDELTKLISTVKGYMKHEKGVLTEVTKARTAFMNAKTVSEKASTNNMLTGALKSLFAVAENYPNLKANQNFMQLQQRMTDIENMIADRREFYNDSVNTYNIRIEQFPPVIIARMLGYMRRDLFKASESDRKDVEVSF